MHFLGWRMVALGSLAQNVAIGLTFGSFGVLIKPVAEDLDISRGLASLGIAVILLLMSLAAPVLGVLLARYPIRRIMSAGAVMMAAGFALAAVANDLGLFLLGFSIVGGVGSAALGGIPATTLASNWFVARAGLAIGLVNVPLLVALAPPAVSWITGQYGWRSALNAMALLCLAMLPLLQLVVSRPEDAGQHALGSEAAPEPAADPQAPHGGSTTALLRSAWFWGVLLAAGLLSCGGVMLVSHIVPFLTDRGIPAASAAWLLSVSGVFSTAGALLCGYVADRIGARRTLGLLGLVLALSWTGLVAADRVTAFLPLLVVSGLCSGGVYTTFSAMLKTAYGRAAFAPALGLASLLTLPFNFVAAPAAGAVFDRTGSYLLAFEIQIAAFLVAAWVFLLIYRGRERPLPVTQRAT